MSQKHPASIADFYTAFGLEGTHKLVAQEGFKVLLNEITTLVGDDIRGYDYLITAAQKVINSDSLRNQINLEDVPDKEVKKRLVQAEKVFGIIHFNQALLQAREEMAQKRLSWGLERLLPQLPLCEINSLIEGDAAETKKLPTEKIANKALAGELESWAEKYGAASLRRGIKKMRGVIMAARLKELLDAKDKFLAPVEGFLLVRDDLHDYEGKIGNPVPDSSAEPGQERN